jgi:hypothetical protein
MIKASELHTTELSADTLLTEWGSRDGEPVFVAFGTWEQVPEGHRIPAFTRTLAEWRAEFPATSFVGDAEDMDEIARLSDEIEAARKGRR